MSVGTRPVRSKSGTISQSVLIWWSEQHVGTSGVSARVACRGSVNSGAGLTYLASATIALVSRARLRASLHVTPPMHPYKTWIANLFHVCALRSRLLFLSLAFIFLKDPLPVIVTVIYCLYRVAFEWT